MRATSAVNAVRPGHRSRIALFALSACVLSGCTVGPHYRKPDVPVPEHFVEHRQEAVQTTARSTADDEALTHWWSRFEDAELASLIQRGLNANLDLQSAASRIRQAREAVIVAGAARFPQLSASGIGLRAHANNSPLMPGSALDLKEYSLGFDATWELDLFGGAQHAVEAARAQQEAAVWRYRDTSVSLSAEIAGNYLSLRDLQARRVLLQTSIDRQKELLDLVAARARTGFVTDLDVNQQRTQLYAVTAELPQLDAQESAMVHSLGVLLAQPPDALAAELQANGALPQVPARLPEGLPSELLRRRPDIRLAERQLAAATAEVGVAVADLYPKFNLLALASFANSSLSKLFSRDSFSTAALGQISWPIFSAGRSRAAVRESEEQQTQAYLAYQKAVLAALQDTQDSLERFYADQARLDALAQQEDAARASFGIARQQYAGGTVTYLNVLQAENNLLQTQEQTMESRAISARDLVALYKALGGGWGDSAEDAAREDTRLSASEASRTDRSAGSAKGPAPALPPH